MRILRDASGTRTHVHDVADRRLIQLDYGVSISDRIRTCNHRFRRPRHFHCATEIKKSVMGIEPTPEVWRTPILTIIRHEQAAGGGSSAIPHL